MMSSDEPADRGRVFEGFAYQEAFRRQQGLITPDEQERLRQSRIAIAGLGGVGGAHLLTLARLGIGGFHIADPDRFELANFNRQSGASVLTLGRSKAEVMAEMARAINPELHLRVIADAISAANVDELLEGVDILIDGVDFFTIETRRLIFREARRRGIWAITAGPIGFSTAWLVFDPASMSFDEYFDLRDEMAPLDQLIAFFVGLTPRASQRTYMDFRKADPRTGQGPSSGLACALCAGVAASEVVKILLKRGPIRSAPWHFQFDAYRQRLFRGRLLRGNRHPMQLLKRWIVRRQIIKLGWALPTPDKTE